MDQVHEQPGFVDWHFDICVAFAQSTSPTTAEESQDENLSAITLNGGLFRVFVG